MRWKTTFVLLLLVVGLGSYISLYEIKRPPPEERAGLAAQVLRFRASEPTQVGLATPNVEGELTFERHEGAWRLTSPLQARADQQILDRLLDEATSLRASRILEPSAERPLPLSEFGLEPPLGTITFVSPAASTTLWFGSPTPVGGSRYVKRSDRPQVFVVSSALFDLANRSLDAFRARELIPLEPWQVTGVALSSVSSAFRLVKQDEGWELVQPLHDRAEDEAVMTLLGALRRLRIERFITDEPQVEQRATWGFDEPSAELTVTLAEPPSDVRLFVGKPTPEDPEQRYVKRYDEPTIYTVNTRPLETVLQDPQALRLRACFEFVNPDVTKIEFSQQNVSWVIERQDDQWVAASDQTALDRQQVEGLLAHLAELKVARFLDDAPQDLSRYGLKSPHAIISVWTEDRSEPQQLMIGTETDRAPSRYGMMSGRWSVVELPNAINEILATPLDALTPQAPEAQVPPVP